MIVSDTARPVVSRLTAFIWWLFGIAPEPQDYTLPDGTGYYQHGALKGFAIPSTMPIADLRAALEGYKLVPSPDARDVAWILEADLELADRRRLLAGPSRLPFEAENAWTDPRLSS
jgi:hypothetical protein